MKKNAQLRKIKFGDDEPEKKDEQKENDADEDKDFDQAPRERTFTFSKALGEEGGDNTDSPQ